MAISRKNAGSTLACSSNEIRTRKERDAETEGLLREAVVGSMGMTSTTRLDILPVIIITPQMPVGEQSCKSSGTEADKRAKAHVLEGS